PFTRPRGSAGGRSAAGVADQRLLLAAEDDQDRSKHGEEEKDRSAQDRKNNRAPQPSREQALDHRLEHVLQRPGIEPVPDVVEPGQQQALIGDRLGAVVDQEYEGQSETEQAEKAQQKADHERWSPAGRASSRSRLLFCGRRFNSPASTLMRQL